MKILVLYCLVCDTHLSQCILQTLRDSPSTVYKSNAGGDLLLPVGWQHSLGFVVASQPMDPALDQNQAELGIFVLENKVTLRCYNYLDFSM